MDKGDIYQTNNYGKLEVLEYLDSRNVRVRFLDTGFETTSTAQNIRKGQYIRDKYMPSVCGVGFSGEGEFTGAKDNKAYRCWEGMLYRCYDEKTLSKHPTYKGCTVAESWHNFQNFCVWFYDNYIEGYNLDKDKLVVGNRVYSESTCTFLPVSENAMLANLTGKTFEFEFSSGARHTTTNRADFCREHNLDPSALTRLVKGKQKTHKGWVYVGER
jgi:hypothetical protein